MGSAALKRRGLPAAIAWHEYEHFPRGRVVYMTDTDLFTVYADRKLQTPALLGEIVHGFGRVEQSFVTRSDAHYRSRPW